MKSTRYLQIILLNAAPLLVAFTLGLTGCANRKAKGSPTLGNEYGSGAEGSSSQYGDVYDPSAEDSAYGGDVPLQGRPDGVNFFSSNVRRDVMPPVYFGFDEYQIPNAEFGKVQQAADYLRKNPTKLILAGHTDLVGTPEYNRNLGELRAQAVRAALVQLGVESGRVQTVSYGEDYPADAAESESANAANRRTEFGFYH
jgi:peptidoglycan-associated lipoprotein